MKVSKTTDIEKIKAILCNKAIYATIGSDDAPPLNEFEPPVNDEYIYIGGYVDGVIMALMVYHKYLNGNECHVQVLPEFRKEYALKFGEQALNFRGTRPLYAEIPFLYQNVLSFALINGFEIVGEKENAYTKNGIKYNVNILEYKEWDS